MCLPNLQPVISSKNLGCCSTCRAASTLLVRCGEHHANCITELYALPADVNLLAIKRCTVEFPRLNP